MWVEAGLVVAAYLAGSLTSAVIACRALGLGDPREDGSGNPGATNVMRLHGKKAALLTLSGDVLKGLLPVLLLRLVGAPGAFVVAGGMAAFLGHLYPVFFGWRGGKGVATFIGALLGFHWLLGAAFIAIWLVAAWLFRYSSAAALCGASFAPLLCWLLLADGYYLAGVGLMAVLLIWRHRSNISNLLAGTEEKIVWRDS